MCVCMYVYVNIFKIVPQLCYKVSVIAKVNKYKNS
jgi:hypothetical protein